MFKTLRGKFMLVYLGLALLAALVGTAGLWNLYRLEESVNNLMTANYRSIDAVSHMMEAIERQDSALLMYLGVDREKSVDLFTQSQTEFLNRLNFEIGNITERGERDVVDALKTDYAEYSKSLYVLQERSATSTEDARRYYTDTAEPLFEKIKTECRRLISINETAMFDSKQNTTDSARRSMVALLALSLAAIVVGFIVARHFVLRFLRPINRLSESIGRVREGDLDQQVDVTADDEAGRLVAEFNNMTRRLMSYEQSTMGSLMAERNKSVAIVRSISDPLLVLDENWRIVLINDACGRFFDVEGDSAVGRHFLEAIHDGALFEHIEQLAAAGEGRRERIIPLSRGGDYYFNLIVTPVRDTGSRSRGTIVALQDVTGLKELDRVKNDFMATISHEFKTPLTSILMAASMMREGAMGELTGDQAEAVEAIREDGDRLLELVGDLLEMMKIESGSEAYRIGPCSIAPVIESAVRGFADQARRRGVELSCSVPDNLPAVDADPEKIRWVLNNLIGNALKYTGEGDSVSVSAAPGDGAVLISVSDTGAGISPDYLDRIFDKFVQGEQGDVEARGTGLGLSVSRDIVRAHGGELTVQSRLDEGSTFTFLLPISTGEGNR